VLVLNGVVTGNDGGGGWQGVTVGVVQAQLQVVQEDVYMGRLGDSARDVQEGECRGWGSGGGSRGERRLKW
jgi:hypothetical protein